MSRILKEAQVDAEPVDVVAPGGRIGRYIVERMIGSGGMGIVYVARDPELDRRVAIKLLHPTLSNRAERGAVLQAEAKIMARLSHPNLCAVYEVGLESDQVFIVMEYVDGATLKGWLAESPRDWRQIMSVMVSAGHGLAAIHRAGIVHRDFKPDNIMIDRDGRVRVMDFGLAGPLANDPDWDPALLERDSDTSGSGSIDDDGDTISEASTLGEDHSGTDGDRADSDRRELAPTAFRRAIGTPGYMAPEQLRGEPIDERADQFSFCVTFYRALYGRRPYPGHRLRGLLAGYTHGRVREPPPGVRVPAWLHQIALRGLAVAPAARYPSMRALLDDLERIPRRRRRARIAAAGTAGLIACVGVALALYSHVREPDIHCDSGRARIAQVWSAERSRAIQIAFAGSGVPYAEAQWERTSAALDRYAERWAAGYRDACEATRVRGEQSVDALDRRMFCLEGRRQELAALADVLADADRFVVERAVQAAHGLSDLDRCSGDAYALLVAPQPAGDDARARVSALRTRLAQVKALHDAGKYEAGRAAAEALAEDSQDLDYAPLRARILSQTGELRMRMGDFEAAEQALIDAAAAAERGRDDLHKAQIYIALIYWVGWEMGRTAEAQRWAALAAASLDRAGGDPRLEALLWQYQGGVLHRQGQQEKSYEYELRALERFESVLGPDHPDVVEPMGNVGNALLFLGRGREAMRYHERAYRAALRVFGPDHPEVGDALVNLGNSRAQAGALADARDAYERALALWTATYGPTHTKVAIALSGLGYVALLDDNPTEAIALYERALAIESEPLGPEHPSLAKTLHNLGMAYLAADQPAAARSALSRARAIHGDARTPPAAQTSFGLAQAEWALGARAHALALAREARAILVEFDADLHADDIDEIDAWLTAPR